MPIAIRVPELLEVIGPEHAQVDVVGAIGFGEMQHRKFCRTRVRDRGLETAQRGLVSGSQRSGQARPVDNATCRKVRAARERRGRTAPAARSKRDGGREDQQTPNHDEATHLVGTIEPTGQFRDGCPEAYGIADRGARRAGARSDNRYAWVRAAPSRAEVACRLPDIGDVTRGGCCCPREIRRRNLRPGRGC
jgi:hypothetical protein